MNMFDQQEPRPEVESTEGKGEAINFQNHLLKTISVDQRSSFIYLSDRYKKILSEKKKKKNQAVGKFSVCIVLCAWKKPNGVIKCATFVIFFSTTFDSTVRWMKPRVLCLYFIAKRLQFFPEV